MKIVEHGKYSEGAFENIVCGNCSCTVRIGLDDIKGYDKPVKESVYYFDGVYKEKFNYFIKCPECGQIINISNRLYSNLVDITSFKKKYISDEDKRIDAFLDWFWEELHDSDSSLFAHLKAYKTAYHILKEGVIDESKH